MATVFLDTSALVRRYDPTELGSTRVQTVCRRAAGHTLLLARLVTVEMAAALNRKVRQGVLTIGERSHLWHAFRSHIRTQYALVPLTDPVLAEAERLVFAHPLRGYDAIHLASALSLSRSVTGPALQFWTADRQQAAAAQAEGLTIELVS